MLYFCWQAEAPFWGWAVASVLLGLGFTFFSGATEAWLVDALKFTGFRENLESVFARARSSAGWPCCRGRSPGGLSPSATNLGVPYLLRGLACWSPSWRLSSDERLGFVPQTGQAARCGRCARCLRASVRTASGNPPVRWMMLAAPFTVGVGIYAFYAMQPYLLELYGDEQRLRHRRAGRGHRRRGPDRRAGISPLT